MDNENKVTPDENQNQTTDIVERSKALFLREIIDEFKRKQMQYDVGREFSKTKRNRNPIVAAIIIGIVLLFGIGAVAVTYYIQENSKNITVDIKDFKDVNLQELLDSAKRFENDLERARRELEDLIRERDSLIKGIDDNARRQISIVESGAGTAANKQNRINSLQAEADREIAAVQEKYAPLIAAKEAEIAELESKIAEYDVKQIQQAREQEEILNNQQRLFDLELEKLTEYYEEQITELNTKYDTDIAALEQYNEELVATLKATHAQEIRYLRNQHANEIAALIRKYNPTFTGEQIVNILSMPIDTAAFDIEAPGEFRSILDSESVMTEEEYANLTSASDSFDTVMNRMKEIPYENSIPAAIMQLEYQHKEAINTYESIWNSLADKVIIKNAIITGQSERIDQFLYALEFLTTTNRENGYILDPRNTEDISFYIDQFLDVEDQTFGLVFREDDEFIGKIQFSQTDSGIKASLVELADEEILLQPYDKILIQVQ